MQECHILHCVVIQDGLRIALTSSIVLVKLYIRVFEFKRTLLFRQKEVVDGE